MAPHDKNDPLHGLPEPDATFADLRGRKSVRATFKLSSNCIEAISIVAAQLGIKQKSLFDHLFEDTETLAAIANKFRNARLQAAHRIQKTYVISRNALLRLEEIATSFNAPRDTLIELSIQRLLPVIANERKRHTKRKVLLKRIADHLEAGRQLLTAAHAELGAQDLLTERLTALLDLYESNFRQMDAFIQKSKGIEAFEPQVVQKVDIVFEEE